MSVLLVLGYTDAPTLNAKVLELYPGIKHYRLGDMAWFVEDEGTVEAVAERLTILNGKLGAQALVLTVDRQSGWVRRDFWDWLRPKLAKTPDA